MVVDEDEDADADAKEADDDEEGEGEPPMSKRVFSVLVAPITLSSSLEASPL